MRGFTLKRSDLDKGRDSDKAPDSDKGSDSVKDFVLEEVGDYIIGSSETECDIHLPDDPEKKVPEKVARISVRRHEKRHELQLWFTPFWEDGKGNCTIDSGAAAEIDVGDTLELGGVVFTVNEQVVETADTTEPTTFIGRLKVAYRRARKAAFSAKGVPRRVIDRQRADLLLARGGESTHEKLMARLGATVHEIESAAVQHIYVRGLRVIRVLLPSFFIGVMICLALAPSMPQWTEGLAWTILISATVLTALASSFLCAPGGMLMFSFALMAASMLGLMQTGVQLYDLPRTVKMAAILVVVAWVGARFGEIVERSWRPVVPVRTRLGKVSQAADSLLFYFVTIVYLAILIGAGVFTPNILMLAIWLLIFFSWSIFGSPWLRSRAQRQQVQQSPSPSKFTKSLDALRPGVATLLETVWIRWRRDLMWRTAAGISVLIPVLIVLNTFDLKTRLGVENYAMALPMQSVMIWKDRGVILSDQDLAENEFYVLSGTDWDAIADFPPDLSEYVPRPPVECGQLVEVSRESTGIDELESFRVRRLSDLTQHLRHFADQTVPDTPNAPSVWASVETTAAGDDSRARFECTAIVETEMSKLRSYLDLACPFAFCAAILTSLGFLILWRASSHTVLARTTALWALGRGAALLMLPGINGLLDERLVGPVDGLALTVPLQLGPMFSAIALQATENPAALLIYASIVLLVGILWLLAIASFFGMLDALLIMQWAWPMSRSEERWPNDDTVKRFYAVLGVVLGTIGTVGVSYAVGAGKASLGLVPAAVVGFLAWMIYTIRKRRGLPVVATDGTHLTVLVTSFWLLQVTLIPLSSFLTFGLLGFLLLALIIALGRIILYRNQWNLSAGHTLSTILLLTFVPAAWFLFEQFALEWLVKMRFFPAVAANLAGILIFAVLLRPVYHGIQWVVEWFSLKPLRPVISRMPELLESLIKSANDKDRADAIKELLQSDEIGLESFVLYSRWENPGGNLKHVLNTHLNYEPPDSLRLSKNLLDQLAREASFIVVRNALREARYAAMCPELWRLQRRLGYVPRSDEEKTWRCKYILPIAVGESLCGLLIVGDQAFPDHIRSESFVERLQNLGVAGV